MNDFELGQPSNFHWLWLVAASLVLMLMAIHWNRRAARRFATTNLIGHLFPRWSTRRRLASTLLATCTLLLLVICIVDVRWGRVRREIPQKGIEVIFLLDVSRSMLAQDVTPNRLERAKQMIKDTIDEMAGDRVGLALFAGETRQQIPLTSHYEDFKQSLDEVGPHNLSRGGSRLGDAITVAAQGFLSQTNDHKAIVLLTDGEDQESKPLEAARRARQEKGVRIFTIGLGDFDQGARIPLAIDSGTTAPRNYLQHEGQQVWSKLNGEVLAQIASETDGIYIPAGTKQVNMSDVYHGYIANVEQKEFETARINGLEARFQWFLAPAILFLVLDVLISTASRTTPSSQKEHVEATTKSVDINKSARIDAA